MLKWLPASNIVFLVNTEWYMQWMGMKTLNNQDFFLWLMKSTILRQLRESQNNFRLEEASGDIQFNLLFKARPASMLDWVGQDIA